MFHRRHGGGPIALALGWVLRALGLGFVLGAAMGVRATRHGRAGAGHGGASDAHVMADRVERALRVLTGRDDEGEGEDPADPTGETSEAGT